MARKGAVPAQTVLEKSSQRPTTKLGKVLNQTRASIKSIFGKSEATRTTPKAVLVKKMRVANDNTTRSRSPLHRSRSPISRDITRHPHTQAHLRAEGIQTRDFAANAAVTYQQKTSPAASLLRCVLDRDTIRLGRQRDADSDPAVKSAQKNVSPSAGLLRSILDRDTIRLGCQREVDAEPVIRAEEESFDANAGRTESGTNRNSTLDIVADAETQSLISVVHVEEMAGALEAADGSSTPLSAWNNNLDFSQSLSARSSDSGNESEAQQGVENPYSSIENQSPASGAIERQLVEEFDPSREFSNLFDGPSDDEDDDSNYETTFHGVLGFAASDSPEGTNRHRRRGHCPQESIDSSFTIIEDYFSDGSNPDSVNELTALRNLVEERDNTISALRRDNMEINWNKSIELNNLRRHHAVELHQQHEAISSLWQHHCDENTKDLERDIASQHAEMITQKTRYGEHLRSTTESYGVALLNKDLAFQMIAQRYESALAEKDKKIAAAQEEAEDANSALVLKEANHKNEMLDLKEDHEAAVKQLKTDLTSTKVKLQKSEMSARQLMKKIKVLDGEVKTQTDLATNSALRLDIARTRAAQAEADLAKTKAIAKIVIKNHHAENKSLKLRNNVLVSANQTALASQENLCYYIKDHENAFFTYSEENKNLKIEVRALRTTLPHVKKDRYQLLDEMARNMEQAHQREFQLSADLNMVTNLNNKHAYEADYYWQEMCNAQSNATTLQSKFDQANKANETMHQLFGELHQEFDEYKEETEGLEEELEDIKTKLESSETSAEKEREEHAQAVNELQNENQALRNDAATSEEVFARQIRLLTNAIRDPEDPDHRAIFDMFRNSEDIVQEVFYSTDGTMTPFLVRNVPVEQAIVSQLERLEDRRLDAAREMYEQWLNTEPNNTPLHPPGLSIEAMLEEQQKAAFDNLAVLRDDASASLANPLTETAPINASLFNFDPQNLSLDFNFGAPVQPESFRFGAQDQLLPIPPVLPSNAPALDYGLQTSTADFTFDAGATPEIFTFGARDNQSLTVPAVVPSNDHEVTPEAPASSESVGSTTPFTFGSPITPPPFNFGPQTPATPAHPFAFGAQPESKHPQISNSFDLGSIPTNADPFRAGASTQSPSSETIPTPTPSTSPYLSSSPSPSSPSAEAESSPHRDETTGHVWQLGDRRWVTEEAYYARLSYQAFIDTVDRYDGIQGYGEGEGGGYVDWD